MKSRAWRSTEVGSDSYVQGEFSSGYVALAGAIMVGEVEATQSGVPEQEASEPVLGLGD